MGTTRQGGQAGANSFPIRVIDEIYGHKRLDVPVTILLLWTLLTRAVLWRYDHDEDRAMLST